MRTGDGLLKEASGSAKAEGQPLEGNKSKTEVKAAKEKTQEVIKNMATDIWPYVNIWLYAWLHMAMCISICIPMATCIDIHMLPLYVCMHACMYMCHYTYITHCVCLRLQMVFGAHRCFAFAAH